MTARALQWLLLLSSALAGCDDHSMTQQKRYGTFSTAALFKDRHRSPGLAGGRRRAGRSRPSAAGHEAARGRRGAARARPRALRHLLLAVPRVVRPRRRHDRAARLSGAAVLPFRAASRRPAQHFFDVITHGYGVMYSYAARVEPRDRWAIVAYIRALQQSQHADVADVPELRSKLP